jgi:uncharacterized membrane protein
MLHDWLMQLEVQRYAASADDAARARLRQLQRQYASLTWPE